ncbi:hypothetical protein G6F62_008445 [Rhizopus arrhizus]|uniref:Mitochondrial cardiolipin hydrolase n=1 Tax=Rhizopus oryzae TaxID=64495 RepID=A0A9P7BV53_RHIOR|nr:hypothetical protein G6F24_006528 [Rhizopus arrhizus]KAG0794474.1 hypothetical protein G6F21_002835 [Rhizopus arrhizus]KAG0798835.1 hypothetical protein G6F22_003829 [Rhizopus arrhizus]KAG0815824.1 hypothetical protein G6F20_003683 [Rhizopus arrhizus]KAG0837090.1 hypothetical protein G6F19_003882 [Rhizopus arrhizus]
MADTSKIQKLPFHMNEQLKQSIRFERQTNDSSLDGLSIQFSHLFSGQNDFAAIDKMFLDAEGAMKTKEDQQVLSDLKHQITRLIRPASNLASPPQSPEREIKRASWSSVVMSEPAKKNSGWEETREFYRQIKSSHHGAPERVEHEKFRQVVNGREQAVERTSQTRGGHPSESQQTRPHSQLQPKKTPNTGSVTHNSKRHNPSFGFNPRPLGPLPENTFCVPIFFPSEESYSTFHSALSSAKRTLYVCVFSLTDNETARVLSDAYKRGLDVRIITDNDQMDPEKGADVLIDDKMVITGSFNWSAGARYKNQENVIVTNIPSVVEAYAKEFGKLWDYF